MDSKILNSILTQSANNTHTVCVFDLDSTLFNVSTRTQQIINEFSIEHKTELNSVEVLNTDWGLREALHRAGYKFDEHSELHNKLRDYWVERFFSNEYLHYDVPYPGAVPFLQKLSQTNCDMHYLTGRDIHRMGKGTREVLLKWGFPFEQNIKTTTPKKYHLHLKPDRQLDDHLFKTEFMMNLFPEKHHTIYFFENEPVNINALGKARPDINLIFLNTTHSRQQTIEVPVVTISDFNF